MYTLGLGILLVLLKYLEVSPVVNWSWWAVLSPFAVTALWWVWADASGHTKRKAMEKMDKRRQDRIDRAKNAMGRNDRR
ncbi:TIGR04438 family Trp-rich protein [Diaphorobacter aerolatus]|uniref:TIGR04438 family Trp-rich protein n=1 Tax=Diaphorobacter aerolatus TaxID=1288495 RepID=A0A7H0GJ32_9BURK|nr:TIGR04438 family Trp-rich protein [Diaphorobacter aerolatus]QNP48298.1 TIGR04438 family Trp-rich protein [Diaphorobacter aerolatus]